MANNKATNIGLKDAFINYRFKYPVSYGPKTGSTIFYAAFEGLMANAGNFSLKNVYSGTGREYSIKAYAEGK